ncbi:hypothetical protein ACFC63_32100 [Streptomyces albidoflavus]
MNTTPTDLYPDVTAAGGLVPAMKAAAELRGCDIDLPRWGTDAFSCQTARGYTSVCPATDEHRFHIRVHVTPSPVEAGSGFSWDIGSTNDLGAVVEAVAAWQEGMSLDDLSTRFTFLELAEFAEAVESGAPTALQWEDLLSCDAYREQRGLLRRPHADEVLGNMFPVVSHRAVRLRVDPLDLTSPHLHVHEAEEGRYLVQYGGWPDDGWREVPSGELVACLRAALTGP